MNKNKLERLKNGVSALLVKNGYEFSEEDKALLEAILAELEELIKADSASSKNQIWELLSLVLRYLKFFGIDDISNLF
jgi:hypothetical protein